MSALGDIVAKFRKGSPNIAAAFDEVERRLVAVEDSVSRAWTELAEHEARLDALEDTTEPPPPPSPTVTSAVAYLNYGNAAPAAHAADYKTLIGLPFRVQGAPGKALRYVSPFAADGANYGVTYQQALANGWLSNATDGSGPVFVSGQYRYITKIHLAAYRNAWIQGVSSLIGNLDGCFCDDVQGYIQAITGGKTPADYPTEAAWYAAIVDFVTFMSNYFRQNGKYFAVNAISNNQDTDGGNTNNGNRNKTFYAALSSPAGRQGVNGIMSEYWLSHPAIPAPGIRLSGSDAWWKFWDNWRSITPQLNAAGVDFYPLHETRGKLYGLATFLLDWDGQHGAYIFSTNYVADTNPWDTDYDKAKALGAPTGPASRSGNVWSRQFQNGRVTVDPFAGTASIT